MTRRAILSPGGSIRPGGAILGPGTFADVPFHEHDFNDISGKLVVTEADITSLSASKITAGTIGAHTIVISAGGVIESSNFVTGPTGTGWQLAGTLAELVDVTIRGAVLISDGTGLVALDDGDWITDTASLSLNRGFTNPAVISVHSTNGFLSFQSPWNTTIADTAKFFMYGDNAGAQSGDILLQSGNNAEIQLAFGGGGTLTLASNQLDMGGHWQVEFSDGDITGDLIPSADSTYDLGRLSTLAAWSQIVGDTLYAANGSAAAPSHTFHGDIDTGMYRAGVNSLGLVAGGTDGVLVGTQYLGSINAATGDFAIKHFAPGTAGNPAYTFTGDINTGMYRIAADLIGFAVGGNVRLSVGANQVIAGTIVTGNPSLRTDAAGDAAAPAFNFQGDNDTGMYWVQAGITGFSSNGTVYFKVTTIGPQMPNHGTSGAAANMFVDTGNADTILRSTASARRYKKYVKDAPIDLTRFSELQARVFQYKRSHLDSDTSYWGLVAEEVEAVYPKMVDYQRDGQVENVRYANLVVVAIEKIKELEEQVNKLTELAQAA